MLDEDSWEAGSWGWSVAMLEQEGRLVDALEEIDRWEARIDSTADCSAVNKFSGPTINHRFCPRDSYLLVPLVSEERLVAEQSARYRSFQLAGLGLLLLLLRYCCWAYSTSCCNQILEFLNVSQKKCYSVAFRKTARGDSSPTFILGKARQPIDGLTEHESWGVRE